MAEQLQIIVNIISRKGRLDTFVLPQKLRWRKDSKMRWAEVHDILNRSEDKNNLHVFLVKHKGFDATEIIVNLANGVANTGVCYFKTFSISVNGKEEIRYEGNHVIRPRGMFTHRFVIGPDAEIVREYKHIPTKKEPSWAPSKAEEEIRKYLERTEDSYGPYKPFWNKFHSLSDSHGGAGIAPYSKWFGSSNGYKLRALEFYGEVCRTPLACLDINGMPKMEDEAYWLGRTPQHELPQYHFPDDYDGWSSYENWLKSYEAHDYTHLWRTIRAASELAPWNPFARKFLQWVWHDCKLWLLGEKGDQSNNTLFWSLQKLLNLTEPQKTAWWAGRGFYHVIRCFLVTKPYLPRREVAYFTNIFRKSLYHVANEYGICFGQTNGWNNDVRKHFGNATVSRGFETQLLASLYSELGVKSLLKKYQTTFPNEVPNWFESNNPSNTYGNEMYIPYQALYKLRVSGYSDAKALIKISGTRGVNGSSQDLDCHHPRSYYSALRTTKKSNE
tara:strand:- start:2591 stop:4093 length:1503 start_codon:yes stop_codon:yes gene_type:complete